MRWGLRYFAWAAALSRVCLQISCFCGRPGRSPLQISRVCGRLTESPLQISCFRGRAKACPYKFRQVSSGFVRFRQISSDLMLVVAAARNVNRGGIACRPQNALRPAAS